MIYVLTQKDDLNLIRLKARLRTIYGRDVEIVVIRDPAKFLARREGREERSA